MESETIEKKKTSENEELKITINNSADLFKIPISVLKNTKVYNFQGKYYEKIYKEALEIENKIKDKKPPIVKNTPIYIYTPPIYEEPKFNNQNINQPIYNNQNNNNFNVIPQNFNFVGFNNFSFNPNQIIHSDYLINNIIFEIQYNTSMGKEIGIIGSLNELGKWNQEKTLKLKWNKNFYWNKEISYINGTDFEFKFVLISNGKIIKWEEGKNRVFKFDNVILNLRKGNKQNGLITVWNLNNMTLEYDIRTNYLKIICDWNKK